MGEMKANQVNAIVNTKKEIDYAASWHGHQHVVLTPDQLLALVQGKALVWPHEEFTTSVAVHWPWAHELESGTKGMADYIRQQIMERALSKTEPIDMNDPDAVIEAAWSLGYDQGEYEGHMGEDL